MKARATSICPHCGAAMPFGDERHTWLNAHMDSRLHRWFWYVMNKLKG